MPLLALLTFRTRKKTKVCAASGCERIIDGGERYCTNHTCQWAHCRKYAGSFGGCVKHSCVKCSLRWHSGKPRMRRGVKYCEARMLPLLFRCCFLGPFPGGRAERQWADV